MNIMVLNCGSSSIKYQLFKMEENRVLAKGVVEKIIDDCGCEEREFKANKIKIYSKEIEVIIPSNFETSKEYLEYVKNNIRTRWKLINPFTQELFNEYCKVKSDIKNGDMPTNKEAKEIINKQLKHLYGFFISGDISCCFDTHAKPIELIYKTYIKE